MHIIDRLEDVDSSGVDKSKVVYFSCRSDEDHKNAQASDVLSTVALRLISTRKEMLRSRDRDFRRLLGILSPDITSHHFGPPSPRSRPFSARGLSSIPAPVVAAFHQRGYEKRLSITPGPTLAHLRELLEEVLTELGSRPAQDADEKTSTDSTTYLLLDRLDCVDEGRFQSLLDELVRLVAGRNAFKVKIVVVVEASLAEGSWSKDNLPGDMDPGRVYEFKMDQRMFTREEMYMERKLKYEKEEAE